MNTNDFNYDLPESFIAQHPLKNRSESKLLVLNKYTGEIEHKKFSNIIEYLDKEDVLVLNNTKVLPARIYGNKETTNAKIEVLLLKEIDKDVWECLARPQKRIKTGDKIIFSKDLSCSILEVLEDGITHVKMNYNGIFLDILNRVGIMPLPPYIHEELKDNNSYQTVYARELGSVAAPTAGLHFTPELLEKIKEKGITIVYITLHVGIGTFRPVSENDITKHKMHSEYYEITKEAASILNRSKKEGKRIICVGTTSVRTLESNYNKYKGFKETCEETNIFIYPPYKFKAVDALITNFHLPKSTLLMLVSALSKKNYILNAYEEAKKNNYRFFSFGDAMFINDFNFKSNKKLYKKLLKEIGEENPYLKTKEFIIRKGNNNIMLSAPHAFEHLRKENIKKREYNTDNIINILHRITSSHIIYTYKNNKTDPNYHENTTYRKELLKYIKQNNIKYFIDIHGLNDNKDYNIELGINNYVNVNNDESLIKKIENIIKDNLTKKIVIDKKYKGGKKTLSYFIHENTNIKCIQIEINKNYRKYKIKPKTFTRTINTLQKIIELLEKEK